MTIQRGSPTIKRRHSRNYTSEQADARLRESVDPYQQQGMRALEVDSFQVKYYHQCRSTTVCTCKETAVTKEYTNMGTTNLPPNMVKQDSVLSHSVSIDYRKQLFGLQSNSIQSDDSDLDPGEDDMTIIDDDDDDDDPEYGAPKSKALFGSSADCAICYKTGYVPGYSLYGYERLLFTTHNVVTMKGFHLDVTMQPHEMQRVDERNGYVEYALEVPMYFKDIAFSVRNNKEILPDLLYDVEGHALTFSEVKAHAGKTILFRVMTDEFTHVVIEIDLGTEKVLANLAQQQKTIDWTLFSTLGNIQIILPPTIQEVSASDVVYVPARKTSFKITDVTYLTTSRDRNLDWSVSTRVLQPQEALSRIHRVYKLGY